MGFLDALLYRNRDWRDWTTGGIAGPIGSGPNYTGMTPPAPSPGGYTPPPYDPMQGDIYQGGVPYSVGGPPQPQYAPQKQNPLANLLNLGNLAQLGMLIGGGKYGGYGVQGYQQAAQQDFQNELKRRQLETETGLNRSRIGLEERRISGEEEERRTRAEELKAQREQGNVSAALTQFESGLAGIDASDPMALTNYAESIAETRGLTPEQTARFMKVAERRAALKPQTTPSPIAAKIAEYKQIYGKDPDMDTLNHFFGIAPSETTRPMEVIDPARPGAPVYANYKNSKFYNVDTGAEIKGARPYEKPPSSGGIPINPDDPKVIAQSIKDGLQPPTFTGLYRGGLPVRAELARIGFDVTKAQTEWNSVQRWVAAAGSTQQLRLRQAVEKIEPHVDVIEGMYSKLEKMGLPTGYKAWNRAALAAARNLPGEAGALASNLEGQINDLTAELSQIYMGGNTPTDQAMMLASKNLNTNWNPQTFKMGLDLIRKNVGLRRNAIRFTGPNGVPTNSPYFPESAAQAPAQTQTPQVEEWERGPDGKLRRRQ